MTARALAEFLRDRRARLPGSSRRTPGLRREEVAERSRMSTEYYTQLEQARGAHPSRETLDSLAGALGLSRAEHDHLFHLAGEGPLPSRQISSVPTENLLSLLDRLVDTAVMVVDAKQELIAWNALASLLFEDFTHTPPPYRNLARRFFLHPDPHSRHFGMKTRVKEYGIYIVAELRLASARYPADVPLAALLSELRTQSASFEELWQAGIVQAPRHMVKKLAHPTAGDLFLQCDPLLVPDVDQRVVVFTAKPRTRSARAIRAMAASIDPSLRGTRRV